MDRDASLDSRLRCGVAILYFVFLVVSRVTAERKCLLCCMLYALKLCQAVPTSAGVLKIPKKVMGVCFVVSDARINVTPRVTDRHSNLPVAAERTVQVQVQLPVRYSPNLLSSKYNWDRAFVVASTSTAR
jgi:hypothetical protein